MRAAFAVRNAVLAVAAVLALAACGDPYRKPVATYTVRAGDTVYSIAWRHRMDYRVLARWNNLPPDYRIDVGQVLRLTAPRGMEVSRARVPARPAQPSRVSPPAPVDRSVAAWSWPADGTSSVVRHTPTSSQGLLISGSEGTPVRAAAAGRVVYSGSGLRGFGNLLIIKHSNVFLSAYGHNRDVTVSEGQDVILGQTIGSMGLGPGQKPALYFEIRYNGTPVDPLAYLPPR